MDLEKLANFLVKAKVSCYAGEGKEVTSQRPGCKELEYIEGDFEYRDSYSGFFFAPGQEVVRFKGKVAWMMAYSGGMLPEFKDVAFAKQTYDFLKKCLSKVETSRPFRGPIWFKEGDFEYQDTTSGDITNFIGTEHILFRGQEVYRQNYIGGLVVNK